jgi:adenosylhomocysteine nucleosidase
VNVAPIGLVAAMREELAALLAELPTATASRVGGRDFWTVSWHGQPLVVVLSGIGKVAAATTATALIERFGVGAIVFTGVAGGLASGARVGDLVVARHLLQHDLDASPLFPRFEVPLTGVSRFATDAALSDALAQAAQAALETVRHTLPPTEWLGLDLHAARVHEGLIVSGDRFVSTHRERAALVQALPDALAVEMECAAMAQVCHDYGVPLAALRTISDQADDQATVDFLRFIRHIASRYSAAVVGHWLRARA